ncbi:MAG: gliding motility-associated C-terminal domain-containing protein [Bacteroidia bacterium]|nr:gliding motility-associated C-terminal domain-containing protein [Bacteroidia bacterium]
MRKLITPLLLFMGLGMQAQDDLQMMGVTAPITPACSYTSTESITVTFRNNGPNPLTNVTIDFFYRVDANPVNSDLAVFYASIPVAAVVSHTYTVPADFSASGNYLLDAWLVFAGDPVTANDSLIDFLIENTATDGGNITPGTAVVCNGANSGSLTLSGETGTIIDWQYSTDGGFTWNPTGNNTNTYNYLNLVVNTLFRVEVQNPPCPVTYSDTASITVNGPSVGGTVTADATVCSSGNSGTLNLIGSTGSVVKWEYSDDGGFSWNVIANTTTSHNYTNLTVTTLFRAIVQATPCPDDTSTFATITVDAAPVGGSVTSNATVCAGSNSGTLTLGGHSGTILNWEFSTDGGFTWTPIANTTTTQNYTNLLITTMYRAVLGNGVCANVNSTPATITVTPPPAGGIVSATQTVCSGSNSGTLTLSGHGGAVVRWERSVDGGFTWITIANVTTSQNFLNLVTTTMYRAVVNNGICPNVNATPATVFVSPAAVGGTVSTNATVCAPTNSGLLSLAGHTGTVSRWEYSTDGGFTWVNISNTTTSHTYSNLTVTTRFRARISNGSCTAVSTAAIITVTPASVGGTTSSSATVCSGTNSGTITLSGHNGSVTEWLSSTVSINGPWTPIANTTTSQSYLNLSATTYYAARVMSGTCTADTSSVVTITIDPVSVAGTLSADNTVCASSNAGTITLAGQTGSILYWEMSTDGGFTWTTLSNNTTSQAYNNLTLTTQYRVIVRSGVCSADTSNVVTITVDPVVVGGAVTSNAVVCSGSNSGTLTLSGHIGSVVSWLSSTTSPAGPWSVIVNSTTSQGYLNLTTTTWYCAIVQSGVCGSDTSSVAQITVDAVSLGGVLAMSDTVCGDVNGDTLSLTGFVGIIQEWQYSTNGGFSWVSVFTSDDSLLYTNLTTTTMYQVIVQNGVCPSDTSNAITIAITPPSNGGLTGPDKAFCEGVNNDSVMVSGYTGTILGWIMSTSGPAGPWTPLVNTSATQTYSGLTTTTWYAAVVQSGGCTPDTSSVATITIHPNPVSVFSPDTNRVCLGTPITFTSSSSVSTGFIASFTWNFGDNISVGNNNPVTHTYLYADTFYVSLMVTSNQGCTDTLVDTMYVNPIPSSVIVAAGPVTFCSGDSVILTAPSGSNYTYLWTPGGATSQTIVADSGAVYYVTVTDTLTGCFSSDSMVVTVNALPVVNAGNDTTISLGTVINLNGSGGGSYAWIPTTVSNPFIADPEIQPTSTTTYILTVTDQNGCLGSDSVTITVENDYIVHVMNLLTPNADGYNDSWVIDGILFYPDNTVKIYNRNGQLVYSKENYDNQWTGTWKDVELPDGTYYYVLTFSGSEKIYKGSVTVLRNN